MFKKTADPTGSGAVYQAFSDETNVLVDVSLHSTPMHGLADHFSRKVADIRAATDGSPPPDVRATAVTSMDVFQPVTEAAVRHAIMASPSKSSSLDPIPTFLLKEMIDVLMPIITVLINASLSQGRQAIVTPLLKKAGVDAADMANYRPVSNLTVERVVAGQMNGYLAANGLLPRLQSAYRRSHSTETALLRVMSDVFAAADQKRVTLLALLDGTSAQCLTASTTTSY